MTVKVTVVTQACYLFDFAFLIWWYKNTCISALSKSKLEL